MHTPLSFALLITSLLCSMTANALTVEELATQFENYKAHQAIEFKKIKTENAQLKNQNRILEIELVKTQDQVDNNTMAVETVSDSVENNDGTNKWSDNTRIGGYGELHYTNRDQEDGDHSEEIDFHRFVLFFDHDFSEDLRFISELELEHALSGEGQNGEVEVEQAYLEYDVNDFSSVKAGAFLLPVGILNETHEPNTFYGVERNDVESRIIPTTWWEAGIGGNMRFDNGLSFDVAVTSGLDIATSGDKAFSIRDGRQKVSEANANDPIIAGRIKYTGLPGLELAGSILHQTDLGQSDNPTDGVSKDVGSGTLFETHVIYSQSLGPGILTGKALFSQWRIDVDADIHKDAENQTGYYFEPSYRMPTRFGDIGIYGRYQYLDFYKGSPQEFDVWEVGANWWPHDNVVIKADFIFKDKKDGTGNESGFDLGMGYQF